MQGIDGVEKASKRTPKKLLDPNRRSSLASDFAACPLGDAASHRARARSYAGLFRRPLGYAQAAQQGPLLDGAFPRGIPSVMKSLLSRITIDPEICHGKPAIRHLRYPVESMLEYLTGGDSIEDLLKEFPDLERDDLLACLEFATQSLKLKSHHLVLA